MTVSDPAPSNPLRTFPLRPNALRPNSLRPNSLRQVVRDVFGFDDFRPGQAAVAETLLAGQDALVLMPTGGGKSLCYQAPALAEDGLTIVVSPLIALMDNQVQHLKSVGAPVGAIHSGRPREACVADWRAAAAGEVRLLYMSPERLMTERLGPMLAWALGFAVLSAVLGFVLAGHAPLWLGFPSALSAAGMIAVVSGAILGLAALFGPARRRMAA